MEPAPVATVPSTVDVTPGHPTPCVRDTGERCECRRCDSGPFDALRATNLWHGPDFRSVVKCYEHCKQHGERSEHGLRLQHACLVHMARVCSENSTEGVAIVHNGVATTDLRFVAARLWQLEIMCKRLDVRTFAAMRGLRCLATDASGSFRHSGNGMTPLAKAWLRLASLHGDVDTTVVLAENAGIKKNMAILDYLSRAPDSPSPKAALLCAEEHAKHGRHLKAFQAARRAIRCETAYKGKKIETALAVEARERCLIAVRALTNGATHVDRFRGINELFAAIERERSEATASARKLPPLRVTPAAELCEVVLAGDAARASACPAERGDLRLVCGTPPACYYVHRALLSRASLFFRNAIEHAGGDTLVLADTGFADCIPRLLRHIYTADHTKIHGIRDALHLADGANYYGLGDVCKQCCEHLRCAITIKTSLLIWSTGYRFGHGNPHGEELMRLSRRQLVYTLADATAVPELATLPRHALVALLKEVGGHRNSNADAKLECLLRWTHATGCPTDEVAELLTAGTVDLSRLSSDGFRFATRHPVVSPHTDLVAVLARGFAERPSRRRPAVDLLPNAAQRRRNSGDC